MPEAPTTLTPEEALALQQAVDAARDLRRLLTDEEQHLMNLTGELTTTIARSWRLLHNEDELTTAIHMVQGFIIQHALQREFPAEFGRWFGDAP